MKILYLLFSFTVGGTERLISNVCNEMSKRGNEIHLYVVNDLIDESLLNTLDGNIYVYLQKRSIGSGNLLNTSFKIAKYIKDNHIDIIHCNSLNSPELVLLSKLMCPKVKIYYTVHGMNQYKRLSKIRKLYRNIICNKIIGISDCVKNDLVKNGSSEKKTLRIYNGTTINSHSKFNQLITERKVINIGCIARFMPSVKGQDVLVEAANILNSDKRLHFKIIFAGGVADNQRKRFMEIEKYIEDNNLSNIVSFIGNVDDVPTFMNSIDICVIPSRTEGFGLTLIEAMIMGVPCIASNVEGLAELVNLVGFGELFDAGKADSLAEAIIKTIDNIDCIKEKASIKKDEVKKQFSIDKMCTLLEKVYSE